MAINRVIAQQSGARSAAVFAGVRARTLPTQVQGAQRYFSMFSYGKAGNPPAETSVEKKAGSILDVANAAKYCRETVRKFDYYAWRVGRHMPVSRQDHFFALHAFFLEVLRSREISREPSICITRLNWWLATLEDVEQERTPREPIARMLQEVRMNSHANLKLLSRLVEYQLFDIERGPMQSMSELEVYGENTRGLMFYLNLHLLGVECKHSKLVASHVGRALGICDVLKKTPYYLAVQRGYLPAEVLSRHNLYFERIVDRVGGDGNVADEFYDVVLELAAYAKKHLEVARKIASDNKLEPHTHRAFLLAQEADYFLETLESSNFDILDPKFRRLSRITVPNKFYAAARANRF